MQIYINLCPKVSLSIALNRTAVQSFVSLRMFDIPVSDKINQMNE